jgi:hypothetical protein
LSDYEVADCRGPNGCGADIIWVKTPDGTKMMPLDAEPTSAGQWSIISRPDDSGGRKLMASRVGKDYGGDKYVSHFATCPNATKFRRTR